MQGTLFFTVDLDDWYHAGWIAGRRNSRFLLADEARRRFGGEGLRGPTRSILELFRKYGVTTTFFVQGEVAREYPDLVHEIREDGHEIACHDLSHISPRIREPGQYEMHVKEAVNIVRSLIGRNPIGYRAPGCEIESIHLTVLSKLGFRYDSSIYPCMLIPGFYGRPTAPMQPFHPDLSNASRVDDSQQMLEFPIAVIPHIRIPAGSGWYLRNFGAHAVKFALKSQLERGYATFFFHPYEISLKVPHLPGIPTHVFRGTGQKMYRMIVEVLDCFRRKAYFDSMENRIEDFSSPQQA